MFHLLRKRRSKRANKKSQGSRVAKVSPVGSMEGESSPKDPAYLAKRRVWKLEHVISDAFHKLVAGKHANVFLTLVVYSDEAPWNGMTECEWTAYYRDALRDITGVAVCGFHTWRVRNAAGVAGRSGSVASDRGNAWLVRALLGGKFARHRGSQNLYYLSHPAP